MGWARKYPNANVGIATGKLSGITVLDVDGPTGKDTLEALVSEFGTLPETVEVLTGSGGRHYYFKYNPEFKNSVKFRPGLDIRNDGGYVIAPTSKHKSGKTYEFLKAPQTTPIAEVPEFLLTVYKQSCSETKNKTDKSVLDEGERNTGLFEKWVHEWNYARTENEIWEGLVEDNEKRCNPPLSEKELKAIYKSILGYPQKYPAYDADGRRNIFLGRDQLRIVADLVAIELASRNKQTESLFKNQSTLVQAYLGNQEVLTREVTSDLMLAELCKNVNWYAGRHNNKVAPAEPSEKLIKLLLAGANLSVFRNLKGVCSWPVVDKVGNLVVTRGYNSAIERIVDVPSSLKLNVPLHPGPGEVKAAVNFLQDELLGDFPFSDQASRANILAALLQMFCCNLIEPPFPLHFIQAPVAGTGKSLLAKLVCYILFGKEPSALTLGENDQETRKRISSQLFSLMPYVFLDNLPPKVHSHSLAAALTTGSWSDRTLGASIIRRVDINTLWLATGNNVNFSGELARRVVLTELDPLDENPSTRKGFKHPDLFKWVKDNRAELIKAVLVLIRNWFIQGQPKSEQAFGSYESYTKVIGGILDAAGIEGFLQNRTQEFLTQDDESFCWNHIVKEWYRGYGETQVSAGKLLAPGILDEEFLSEFLSSTDRHTSLGMKLGQVKNRVFSGLKIVPSGRGDKGQKLYKLKKISGNLKPFDTVY